MTGRTLSHYGRIYLGTSDRTLAALNVEANPRVTILFNLEREPADRRVLRIHGRATVRTDAGMCRSYVRRDVRKYFMSWAGLFNTLSHALRRSPEKAAFC